MKARKGRGVIENMGTVYLFSYELNLVTNFALIKSEGREFQLPKNFVSKKNIEKCVQIFSCVICADDRSTREEWEMFGTAPIFLRK